MNSEKHTGERKYSIIDKKTFEYLSREKKKGTNALCFNKFKADFVIDTDIQNLKVGDEIEINGTLIKITKIGKDCYPNDCDLYKETGKTCCLTTGVVFAK